MSQVMRTASAGAVALAFLLFSPNARTADAIVDAWAVPHVPAGTAIPKPPEVRKLFGTKPLELRALERRRAGTDVFNDAQLRGVVTNNSAVNVATGNNVISDGAFSGQSGIPLVVQNSGNNVLIQNATIINLQVK